MDPIDLLSHVGSERFRVLKRFLLIQLPIALLIALIIFGVYWSERSTQRLLYRANERQRLQVKQEFIATLFRSIVSDLLFLGDSHELREFLETRDGRRKRELEEDWLALARRKAIYDQIRFIDRHGDELVRINYFEGSPAAIARPFLQNKASRPYFSEAMRLKEGEVFVSPLDLNVENEIIERPIKPMIRFATPIADGRGVAEGIVVINYLGAHLLSTLREEIGKTPAQIMLLNRDGYWLLGPDPRKEWGFMEGTGATFAKDFPDAWRIVSVQETGQFENADGLYTFITIHPLIDARITRTPGPAGANAERPGRPYIWKCLSLIPEDALNAGTRPLLRNLMLLYALLLGGTAVISLVAARTMAHRKQAEEALVHMAITDQLTGIFNRRHLMEHFMDEFERVRRQGKELGCLMIDIDQFKAINDRHGHLVGDEVLKGVVDRIRRTIRPYDIFGRFGGEEFVMLLPDTDLDGSYRIAERLRSLVEDEPVSGIRVTISIGVAGFRERDVSIQEIIRRSDNALYQAKREGRNRVARSP